MRKTIKRRKEQLYVIVDGIPYPADKLKLFVTISGTIEANWAKEISNSDFPERVERIIRSNLALPKVYYLWSFHKINDTTIHITMAAVPPMPWKFTEEKRHFVVEAEGPFELTYGLNDTLLGVIDLFKKLRR